MNHHVIVLRNMFHEKSLDFLRKRWPRCLGSRHNFSNSSQGAPLMSGRIIIALLLLLLLGSRIIRFFIGVFHTLLFRLPDFSINDKLFPAQAHTIPMFYPDYDDLMFQGFSDQTNNKATPQSTDFTTPQYSQNFHLHLSRPTSYHDHHNHIYYHHDHHHHHLVQSSTTNNCQLFTRGSHVLPG